MRAFGEGFCVYSSAPIDTKTVKPMLIRPRGERARHPELHHANIQKWGIHSTYTDNPADA